MSFALAHQLVHDSFLKIESFAPQATALVSTRLGGISQAPYDSFNLAHHVGDDLQTVLQQREKARIALGAEQLYFMDQIHSNHVVVISKEGLTGERNPQVPQTVAQCDALVCAEPSIALAVMTADCLPLLLCDMQQKICAAVHCGWRGLERDIIACTLDQMESLGAEAENIMAFMGPAIGPQSFEVGAEVKEAFVSQDSSMSEAFTRQPYAKDKYLCDIYALCRKKLARRGVCQVSGGEYDTMKQTEFFYSYRAAHQTGRLASMICLKE